MSFLKLENISFSYDKNHKLINDLNLELDKGQRLAILGGSGSGKSTILRLIAGFLEPSCGDIHLDGKIITNTPPHKRNIGFLFQDYALFPHLNVIENICFGMSGENKKQKALDLLDKIKLNGYEKVYPKELSGGQQQRVALARALAAEPKLILLDEPFSALDSELKSSVRAFVSEFLNSFDMSVVMVTHDVNDVDALDSKVFKIS